MQTRIEETANYRAIYLNGKTIRFTIDPNKPITELKFPEFYDVAINTWCAGRCPFCYTDAKHTGIHFPNIVQRITNFFGPMSSNERPFQVALGGAGEPTAHPDFIEVLKTFSDLGITPNYTTNGMHITEEILNATVKYCGGVALSCHPHLSKYWKPAVAQFRARGIKLNLHVIVSDKTSIQLLDQIYQEYKQQVDYFVLLPYQSVGRAPKKHIDYEALELWVNHTNNVGNLAFGSNFFEFLKDKAHWDVSIYPPEIMSKYLILDEGPSLYSNSFELRQVNLPKLDQTKVYG